MNYIGFSNHFTTYDKLVLFISSWLKCLVALVLYMPEYLHSPMESGPEVNKGTDKSTSLGSRLQWSQWQLLDSILPTGGFAHSSGLEAAVQTCLVSSVEDVRTYLTHVLENTGSLLLPFVYSATMSPNMENWHKLDKILDATLTNEVGRKASIAQGSALMRVAAAAFSEVLALKIMRDTLWVLLLSTMLLFLVLYVGYLGLTVKLLRGRTCLLR